MLSRSRSTLVLAVLVVSLLGGVAPAQADPAPEGVGGKLSGVVQNDHGKALAGAKVSLADSSGAVVVTSTVEKDGHYDVAVAPGTYTLEADGRSGGSQVRVAVPGVVVGADSTLDVVAVGRADGLVEFRGRVVDQHGAPLGGTTVDLMGDTRTTTDGDGRFVLGIRRGVYTLRLWSERFSVTVPDFDLSDNRVGDLTLPLVDYDVIVRNAAGALLANTPVEIYPTPKGGTGEPGLVPTPIGDASWAASQWTDIGGHIHVQGLATDKLTLDIYRRGTVAVDARGQTSFDVTVPDPSPTTTPPGPSTVRLSGTLTDIDGVGATSPSVGLLRPDGFEYGAQRVYSPGSGPGAFTIDAPPGTYQLHLSESIGELEDWEGGDPEGDSYSLSSDGFHHDGLRTIAFRLPAGPGLTVRVVDYDGLPVAGAVVTATSTAPTGSAFEIAPGVPGSGGLTSVRLTGDDGRAALRTLPGPVSTTVQVDAPAERGFDADVNVPAGATTVDVALKGGVVVSGTIRQGGHPGSPGGHFNLVSDHGETYGPIDVGFDGSYRVSVRPGTYSVETDNDDDEPGGESDDHWNSGTSSSTFNVTGDRTLNLDYPAVQATTLRFVGSDGAPIEAEIGYSSSSGNNGLEIAPGITATGWSSFSSFGSRDQESVEVWPGGTVSGAIDPSVDIPFSGVRLTPGGDAVIVLAQGYSLVKPDPPAGVTATAGPDGSATISWDGTANGHGNPIVGYQLELRSDTDDREMITPAVTCTTITGLRPNTQYRAYVSAMTRRGIGESGLSGRFETPASIGPQAAPAPACPSTGGPTGPPSPDGHSPTNNSPADSSPTANFRPSDTPGSSVYWALGSDGAVYNFGAAGQLGNATTGAVDLEPTPSGKGYWVLNRNGRIQALGDGTPLCDVDLGKLAKGETPASLSATPSGQGYWVFTNRGRAIPFGDAPFLGDVSGLKLNGPVLGSVATPSGQGYYMVASDGGIFAFGDAKFVGSMGGTRLNAPVQSLVPDSDGKGYWLVAADGGIFAFDAPFKGSLGNLKLNKPIVGMVRYGDGYLMVGADGGIFTFSSLPFSGSLGDKPPASPVVAVAALPAAG